MYRFFKNEWVWERLQFKVKIVIKSRYLLSLELTHFLFLGFYLCFLATDTAIWHKDGGKLHKKIHRYLKFINRIQSNNFSKNVWWIHNEIDVNTQNKSKDEQIKKKIIEFHGIYSQVWTIKQKCLTNKYKFLTCRSGKSK